MSVPTRRILDPIFGSPILRAANSGSAAWTRVNSLGQWQKGTGWQANLYGGVQSGDDWAAVFFPVGEMAVPDFNSALWSYYMTATQTMGVNIVIWIHDPRDYSKRAEVTQLGGAAGLGKAAGWNSHAFNVDTTQMFFYGENTTGTGLTAGTQYKWSEFQSDVIFRTWSIYRISLEYGWEASGTFDHVWVAEAKFNGQPVRFLPEESENVLTPTIKTVSVTKALEAAGNYDAEDVLSETDTASAGTCWTFAGMARSEGGSGYITKAQALYEQTGITPRLTLYLFDTTPTSELDDQAANTAVLHADQGKYIGRIDFNALEDLGGDSSSIATPSTAGNLPIAFTCTSATSSLYGILVTRDAITGEAAGADMIVKLTAEQY